MNISKESTGDLTATIKIEVAPEDYQEQVETTLRDVQKKTNLKGFRPGKVPFGLIKKMYGKGAVAEEINKLLSETLNNYIKEQDLDILGYPLASKEKNTDVDFEHDTNFEFFFDVGLSPEIDVDLDGLTMDYYDIEVEDEKVDAYLNDVRGRYGEQVNPENAEKGDLLKGEIVQLDAEGNTAEEGVRHNTSLSINFIKDEKVQKEFIGKAVGDKIRFNPLKATENETETANMLGIKANEKEKLESDYEFTITEISKVKPAEMNEEFYKKVYPNDDIKDEETFREKLREEANHYFQKESDNFFVHEVIETLIDKTDINLPDEFVKRWLAETDENKTPETVTENYDSYARSLKQQIIINKISKENDIKIEREDVKEHIKQTFIKHYFGDTVDEEKSKQLDTIAESYMQNQEEVNKIYDQLYNEKIRAVFKEKINLNKIPVKYDDFVEKVNEHHKHVHHHEHE